MARPNASSRRISTDHALAALEIQARIWSARAAGIRTALESMREQLRQAARARKLFPPPGALSAAVATEPLAAPPAGRKVRGRRLRVLRAPRGKGAGSTAAAILREWGRPAKVNELLAELGKRGLKVGGMNPYNTLTATLLQHSGVERAGPGLFSAAAAPEGKGRKGGAQAAEEKSPGPG